MSTFFLDQNPSEAVIFCAKKKNSKDDLNKVKSILNSKIPTDSFLPSIRIPTRNEVRGKIGFPKKNAKKINNHLMEYNWQKKNYGIIIIDFADQELAHKIYSINEKVKAFYFALTFFCLNISKLNTAAALAESKAFLKSLPYSTTIFCLEAAVMVELSPLKAPPRHKQKSDSKV